MEGTVFDAGYFDLWEGNTGIAYREVAGGTALFFQGRISIFCFGHLPSCHIFHMPQGSKVTSPLLMTGW